MDLKTIKLFILPLNTPAPTELKHLEELKGSFSERIAAAEHVEQQAILGLSAAEAATLAAHPEVFNLPVSLYITHLPGGSYEPLLDASIARLGTTVALWDALKAQLGTARVVKQRTDDTRSWDDPTGTGAGFGAPPSTPDDDES